MKPITSQRKFVLGLAVITVTVIVAAVLLVAFTLSATPAGAPFTIKKTDRQVYLLGTSANTEIILEQLEKGTSNIVQINSLSQLPTNASGSMLFIDGQWPMGQPNATYTETAAAIAPLILNGTPVIIVDGDDFVIHLALEGMSSDDNGTSYLGSGGSYTWGNPSGVKAYGYFYNQTTGFSSTFGSCLTDSHDKAIEYNVITAYNWADDHIAGALPEGP